MIDFFIMSQSLVPIVKQAQVDVHTAMHPHRPVQKTWSWALDLPPHLPVELSMGPHQPQDWTAHTDLLMQARVQDRARARAQAQRLRQNSSQRQGQSPILNTAPKTRAQAKAQANAQAIAEKLPREDPRHPRSHRSSAEISQIRNPGPPATEKPLEIPTYAAQKQTTHAIRNIHITTK